MGEDQARHRPAEAAAKAHRTDLPSQRPHEVVANGEVDDRNNERGEEKAGQQSATWKGRPTFVRSKERPEHS